MLRISLCFDAVSFHTPRSLLRAVCGNGKHPPSHSDGILALCPITLCFASRKKKTQKTCALCSSKVPNISSCSVVWQRDTTSSCSGMQASTGMTLRVQSGMNGCSTASPTRSYWSMRESGRLSSSVWRCKTSWRNKGRSSPLLLVDDPISSSLSCFFFSKLE